MRRAQLSITVIGLAAVFTACGGSGQPTPPQQDSAGGSSANPGGSGGNANGGTLANPGGGLGNTGQGGNPTGGTLANPGGGLGNTGQGGNATGGSIVNPAGGAGGKVSTGGSVGNATGGAIVNPAGGAGGKASTGGSVGNATGGSVVNPAGGAGGKASTGGSISNATGGSGVKATGGAGGNAAGGTPSTGGGTSTSTVATTTVVTSASGAYWKTGTLSDSTGTATVTVNDASASQTWDGFGGAFNELGWSYLTTAALQTQAVQALFGKDGCNFAWGRIPIGASDYATSRYTDDETANDTTMASFSITRDQQKLIPYIKAALAVKSDIRFWGSPWTPPTWMKTGPFTATTGSGTTTSSNFDSGNMKNDDTTFKAYAQYLIKWVQAFQAQGINVSIVSPQNEPNYEQNYPSCHWATADFVKFVSQYFGPAITTAGLSIKIMDGTLSNPSGDADIGSQILQNATAKSYIGAIGVQWGMSSSSNVNTLKNLAGGIPIWLSETECGGSTGSSAPAPNDIGYANDTWGYITGAIKNGLTAYNAWNMVLDAGGQGIDDARKWNQNALIVSSGGSLTLTPAYYVYRHFSQFAAVGAKVVATSGGDAIGFKNPDGSLVAVMHNSGAANSAYVVSIGGKKLQFSMPASGWATVVYAP